MAFLNKVKAHAEDKGITICMEYLNSKVNHKDYMFDHIAWGVDVMKRVNSPRVKILYDIYHAQIMDGDIVRNIRDNFQWIGHFHTGGNPDRKEIDDTQELNYRFIAKAIADLNYTGYMGHEYSPRNPANAEASLKARRSRSSRSCKITPYLNEARGMARPLGRRLPLHTEQVCLQFLVAVFGGPKIQHDGGQFVHLGHCAAIACQVDRLEIDAARVARFHPVCGNSSAV